MVDRYAQLLDENVNLKKALTSTRSSLERTVDDYKTLKLIHEELKTQNTSLDKENKELFIKNEQISQEKKEIEMQFDTTIRNLKNSIEQKQKEIEDVQTKVMPILDQDMIKIKLINELEVPHKLQMEAKIMELEKLQDENYELKRQIELALAKNEALKTDKEKDIRNIQNKAKMDFNELTNQISDLTERLDDNRDKEIIRALKKDIEELKLRLNHKDNEVDDIHNELNRAKEEKQQLFIKLTTKLDQEKDEKLQAISTRDKLQKKVLLLDEDIKKMNEKLSQKTLSNERIEKDLMETKLQITNKEDIIKSLYKKIDERFEENLALSQKHKDEVIKLTDEYDYSKRSGENEKNKLIDKFQNEIEVLNENKGKLVKELEIIKKNIGTYNDEIRDLQNYNAELLKRLEYLENENHDKENEKMRIQSNLNTLKNKGKNEEKPVKDIEPIENNVNKEKNNSLQEENSRLKSKIKKYSGKLAQANKKILDLIKEKAEIISKLKITNDKNIKPNTIRWEDEQDEPTLDEKLTRFKGDYNQTAGLMPNSSFNKTINQTIGYKPYKPYNQTGDYEKQNNEGAFSQTTGGYAGGYNLDGAKINHKDDLLLQEINRNINKGMEFYNV